MSTGYSPCLFYKISYDANSPCSSRGLLLAACSAPLPLLTRNLEVDLAGESSAVVIPGKALVLALVVLWPSPAVEVDDQCPRPPPHGHFGVLRHVEELPVPCPGKTASTEERLVL